MPTAANAADPPLDIYFVILPGVLLLDLAGPAEAFRIADRFARVQDGRQRYRLHFVGPDAQPDTSLGIAIAGVAPLPEALPDEAIIVLVGNAGARNVYQEPPGQAAAGWLQQIVGARHRVCCVCSAALLAAAAGLLDQRRCTTHHSLCSWLAETCPQARVLENRTFVQDGLIYTSAGIATGIDLALHLISELDTPQRAVEVARELVVYFRRTGDDPQLSPWLKYRDHLHPGIHRLQDAVLKAPERQWNLAMLAETAHMSERNLTRQFRLNTGASVLDYVQLIRITRARELLATSDLSLDRVAALSGFGSARDLRRVWKRFEADSPSVLRNQPAA